MTLDGTTGTLLSVDDGMKGIRVGPRPIAARTKNGNDQ
jgi:hypothetical protein